MTTREEIRAAAVQALEWLEAGLLAPKGEHYINIDKSNHLTRQVQLARQQISECIPVECCVVGALILAYSGSPVDLWTGLVDEGRGLEVSFDAHPTIDFMRDILSNIDQYILDTEEQ